MLGAVIVLLATRWGIGTSPDSIHYIQAARYLGGTPGTHIPGDGAVMVQHAPLYPVLLAAAGFVGADPYAWARWLNAALFGLNIVAVGALVRGVTRHWPHAWIVAVVLTMVAVPVLAVHLTALTEPLFLLLTLLALHRLSEYDRQPTLASLVAAAAVVALAFLTRYAGVALILTAAAVILRARGLPGTRRVRDVAVFTTIAAAPMAAWLVRNLLVGSTATNRELAFHPVGLQHAWQAVYTAAGWLHVPQSAPDVVRVGLLVGLAAVVFLTVRQHNDRSAPATSLVNTIVLFLVSYVGFLGASLSLFDANTPLDDRILLPVLVGDS
jgi:hypothetical protein